MPRKRGEEDETEEEAMPAKKRRRGKREDSYRDPYPRPNFVVIYVKIFHHGAVLPYPPAPRRKLSSTMPFSSTGNPLAALYGLFALSLSLFLYVYV